MLWLCYSYASTLHFFTGSLSALPQQSEADPNTFAEFPDTSSRPHRPLPPDLLPPRAARSPCATASPIRGETAAPSFFSRHGDRAPGALTLLRASPTLLRTSATFLLERGTALRGSRLCRRCCLDGAAPPPHAATAARGSLNGGGTTLPRPPSCCDLSGNHGDQLAMPSQSATSRGLRLRLRR